MIVLFGAGAAGKYTLNHLRAQGETDILFADNNPMKWNTEVGGVAVLPPANIKVQYPDAEWVATCISAPAKQIRYQIQEMGVKHIPLHCVLPCHHGLPPKKTQDMLLELTADVESYWMLKDQLDFRTNPDYDAQRMPYSCDELYFPDFIKHCDNEHFVDCGAADGDTVKDFRGRWSNYGHITAYEPDLENYIKLTHYHSSLYDLQQGTTMTVRHYAMGDHHQKGVRFIATGDKGAHLGDGSASVELQTIDHFTDESRPPTYIKMDIEGSELEALWGARKTMQQHSPVLAVCAYHKSEDLWQIPLLIHSLNPDYKLYFRRYAEGAWEIVWYAVPPERVR